MQGDEAQNFRVTESDWAGLTSRVDTFEGSIRALASGHVQLVEQMAEITISQRRADLQMVEQSRRLDDINLELAANSKATREVLSITTDLRDVVITAKTGGRLVRWAAPTVVALAATAAAIKAWFAGALDWLTH